MSSRVSISWKTSLAHLHLTKINFSESYFPEMSDFDRDLKDFLISHSYFQFHAWSYGDSEILSNRSSSFPNQQYLFDLEEKRFSNSNFVEHLPERRL